MFLHIRQTVSAQFRLDLKFLYFLYVSIIPFDLASIKKSSTLLHKNVR